MLFPTSGYLKLLWVHLSYVEYVAGKLLSDTSTTVGDKGLQLTTQCWGWGTETLPRTLKVKLLPWLFWKQDALHASHGANSVFVAVRSWVPLRTLSAVQEMCYGRNALVQKTSQIKLACWIPKHHEPSKPDSKKYKRLLHFFLIPSSIQGI